jgi:hypothetical protein
MNGGRTILETMATSHHARHKLISSTLFYAKQGNLFRYIGQCFRGLLGPIFSHMSTGTYVFPNLSTQAYLSMSAGSMSLN